MYIENLKQIQNKINDTKKHYFVALFADGTYKEIYNTLADGIVWLDVYKQSYKLVLWDL